MTPAMPCASSFFRADAENTCSWINITKLITQIHSNLIYRSRTLQWHHEAIFSPPLTSTTGVFVSSRQERVKMPLNSFKMRARWQCPSHLISKRVNATSITRENSCLLRSQNRAALSTTMFMKQQSPKVFSSLQQANRLTSSFRANKTLKVFPFSPTQPTTWDAHCGFRPRKNVRRCRIHASSPRLYCTTLVSPLI